MINNKKLTPVVTELFIRGRTLNVSIVFITQSYFKVPKEVNTKHYTLLQYETSTNCIKSFIRS